MTVLTRIVVADRLGGRSANAMRTVDNAVSMARLTIQRLAPSLHYNVL